MAAGTGASDSSARSGHDARRLPIEPRGGRIPDDADIEWPREGRHAACLWPRRVQKSGPSSPPSGARGRVYESRRAPTLRGTWAGRPRAPTGRDASVPTHTNTLVVTENDAPAPLTPRSARDGLEGEGRPRALGPARPEAFDAFVSTTKPGLSKAAPSPRCRMPLVSRALGPMPMAMQVSHAGTSNKKTPRRHSGGGAGGNANHSQVTDT